MRVVAQFRGRTLKSAGFPRWTILSVLQQSCYAHVGFLAFVVILAAINQWPRNAAAQTQSERSRPNASVRSNRVPRTVPIVQLQGGSAGIQNAPPTHPAAQRQGIQELPEMQPRTPAGAEEQPQTNEAASGSQQFRVPLQEPDFSNMRIKSEDGLISLVARNATLRDILTLLAESQGLNVVTADPLTQTISVTLERVQLNDALEAVLSIAGYTFSIQRNIILVSSLNNAATVLTPQAQGLRLEVFQLDYVMAQDVNTAVTGMLSPLGQSFIVASSDTENRRGRELVAVNDLPQFLDRVRQYVAQVDIPPRQVMIEAHILQVELDDQNRHGVNLDQLFRRNGNLLLEMHTTGFANPAATQAFTFRYNDGNLTAFLEALRTQTNAKTLASPRILVLNGQQARLQVGQQLGFRVTTTTETSTTESVDFLDVGVVLEVTPRISRDGKIMMSVKPEVSSGQVNPATGLPEEETTELDTDILLCDHEGIMIGGLIQEQDDDLQTKVSWIGDWRYIGRLFQRRTSTKHRREIIITLIPRLLPYEPHFCAYADEKYEQADTPLLQGPLVPVPRPWEARLPDAIENPVTIRLPPVEDYVSWGRCPVCGQVHLGEHCPNCLENLPEEIAPPIPPSARTRVLEEVPSPPSQQTNRDEGNWQVPPPVYMGRLPSVSPSPPAIRISDKTLRSGPQGLPRATNGTVSGPSRANPVIR